jgi:hypothetical protein
MEKIVLFNPANGTLNSGDFIIDQYIKEEMSFLFDNATIVEIGTHHPISHRYQNIKKNILRKACDNADFKFICGTNIIKRTLIRLSPDWSITPCSCPYYKGSIAIGVGMDNNSRHSNLYTKSLYKAIFSKDYIHSVRDENTKRFLNSLGFSAINTGCPTMWGLNENVCGLIPSAKHENVVFTLTDYNKNPSLDAELVQILKKEYKKISFWVQGYCDFDYLSSITDTSQITLIGHSLYEFEKFLSENIDVDYVGTRLHAGIFAMRHGIRSIILSIDNRTTDMKESYNLHLVLRSDIDTKLEGKIESSFATDIHVPTDKIEKWKKQFVC